jgi:ABC-type nitrate/sulfonate/bicarbonate transport system permease component
MAVASEYYASDHGVGYYVFNSEQVFAARDTWSGTILLGVLGYLLSLLSRGAEHIVLRWHTNMRHAMSDGSQAH